MVETRHVVAAGVVVHEGRVLLCRRRNDAAWYPAVWDLVGGHVEPGEAPGAALVRECREELGIAVTCFHPMAVFASASMTLHAYAVLCWKGQPRNAAPEEHDWVCWFCPDELASLVLSEERIIALVARALALTENAS